MCLIVSAKKSIIVRNNKMQNMFSTDKWSIYTQREYWCERLVFHKSFGPTTNPFYCCSEERKRGNSKFIQQSLIFWTNNMKVKQLQNNEMVELNIVRTTFSSNLKQVCVVPRVLQQKDKRLYRLNMTYMISIYREYLPLSTFLYQRRIVKVTYTQDSVSSLYGDERLATS